MLNVDDNTAFVFVCEMSVVIYVMCKWKAKSAIFKVIGCSFLMKF